MRSKSRRSIGALAALAAIFAVALVLRLAWLGATDTELLPLSDPQYYHATAQNIADGRGYSVALDERGFVAGDESEATAFWAPGYSFALAALYKPLGDDIRVGKVFNALAGALTVLPVFVLGRTVGGASPTANSNRQAAKGARADSRTQRAGSLTSDVRRQTSGVTSAGQAVLAMDRGDAVGLLAAALLAVAPAMIFWTASLFSEPLFTLGIATTLAAAVWARERAERAAIQVPASSFQSTINAAHRQSAVRLPASSFQPTTIAAYFVVGVSLIATAFVRSQAVLMIVPVAVLLLRDLRPATITSVAAPIALAAVLFVVPWAIRNESAMGRPYLINNNLGYNLRIAHAPYSTGTSIPPQDLWDEQPGISFHERELLFDDLGRERAWEYAREHPGRELELAFKRVGYLLRSDAEASVEWSRSLGTTPLRGDPVLYTFIGDVFWYPLLALAALSVFALPRTRIAWAMWTAAGVWVLLHTVFAGEPRYHVPIVPVIVVLAAATLVRAYELLRAQSESAAVGARVTPTE